jgi:hypothetical protein
VGVRTVTREPIYLDAELCAIDDVMAYYDEAAEADIEPPKNYGEEAAARYIEREKAHRRAQHVNKAALNPDLCRIAYLGVWWPQFTAPALMPCENEHAEREVLAQWWDGYGEGEMICGFNVRAIDLAFICRRSLYLDIRTKHINRDRYRSTCILDLLELLSEGRKDHMRSLDWYVRRFKLDVPHDPIDGAQIPALVAAGEWDKVREHLRCDLYKTRALALRVVPSLRELAVTA